ncbi:MAG: methyltransferase domain-containing protein [Eubacteriales bacterium]|nr:methyltransferase domain-containing protein [Eubacteriales bacterium]
MQYKLVNKFDKDFIKENIMGPNPAKLLEETLALYPLQAGSTVLDLGCGRGVTSIMLAREYGLRVFATDLWIAATDNFKRFTAAGLNREQIVPIHADAHELPYAEEFFDAAVSIDSYQYFGLDPDYLGTHLLPLVKHGGKLILLVPGFRKDVHENLPPELLLSWTPEALDTIHDCAHWRTVISATE